MRRGETRGSSKDTDESPEKGGNVADIPSEKGIWDFGAMSKGERRDLKGVYGKLIR